jgi:hypothetical protein
MASTFSPSLRIELIGDGDQSGIWGQTTNTNLGTLIEQGITGVQGIAMSNANYTLTNFNGVSDEARNAVLVVTGSNTAQRDVIAPLVEKTYLISNNTTGGFAIRIIGASGLGVVIPNGITALVYCDGTNFYNAISGSVGNFTVNGNLAVTGTTALSGALTYGGVTLSNAVTGTGSMALSASPTFTGTPIAPTAAPGTNTTQIATTAFALANSIPSGAIILWSGSIASIPSGWLLCDGTSGTPDLRNRFIVGAGSTYAVAATGGTADAVVVSHTHTATDSGHTHGLGNTVSTTTPGSVVTYTGPGGGNAFQSINTLTGSTNSGTANISVSTTGVSGTNQNLPPYYALAYIMKT